ENERYWVGPREGNPSGGVDLYVGGVEHAVLHLLYSRFWHKVLFDLGVVSSFEPYHRLFNPGYIQAYAYTDSRGDYMPAAEAVARDGAFVHVNPETGEETPVQQEYGKMGKSLKNSVSPDEICDNYGADTLRVYEMSMGPLDTSRPWATKDVIGAQRFLQRAWRLVVDETSGKAAVDEDVNTLASLPDEDRRAVNRALAGVHEDYTNLHNNTAVAKLIELVNYLTKQYGAAGAGGAQGAAADAAVPRAAAEALALMLAPVAPHLAEELWQALGGAAASGLLAGGAGQASGLTQDEASVAFVPYPAWEKDWLADDQIEMPVQITGKVRARIMVAADASREDLEAAALPDETVQAHIEGETVQQVHDAPGRMNNDGANKCERRAGRGGAGRPASGGLALALGVEDQHRRAVNRPADRHWHDEPDHRDPRAPALVALPLVIADIRRAEEPEKAHQSWGDVEEQPESLGA